MCNSWWTGQHTFIWTGSSTSSDARIPDNLVCQCGAFYYNGRPTKEPVVSINDLYEDIGVKPGYLGNVAPLGAEPDVP